MTVNVAALERLAGEFRDISLGTATNGRGSFDVDRWIREHGVSVVRKGCWGDGGRRWILERCPWNPDHTNLSAYIVQMPGGALAAGCHHNGCAGKDWHALRDAYEPGWRERREARAQSATNAGNLGQIRSAAYKGEVTAERLLVFQTAREIAETTEADIVWYVEPYLAAGALTEIDGKIKSAGKTTFVTHMCAAAVAGKPFLDRPTRKTAVVYLTEQGPRSFREAMRRAGLLTCDDLHVLFWHQTIGATWPEIVRVAWRKCEDVGAGVLVVDTLSQFANIAGDSENNAGAALEAMRPVQEVAAAGIAVVVVRHERKSGGDVGDSARGSSAFAGAVDVVMAIRRGEGNTRPTVRVIHALSRFDETPDTLVVELRDGHYVSLGSETRVALTDAKQAIVDHAPINEETALSLDKLVAKAEVARTIGQAAAAHLVEEGVLAKIGDGVKGRPFRYFRLGVANDIPPQENVAAAESIETTQSDQPIDSAGTHHLIRGGMNPNDDESPQRADDRERGEL